MADTTKAKTRIFDPKTGELVYAEGDDVPTSRLKELKAGGGKQDPKVLSNISAVPDPSSAGDDDVDDDDSEDDDEDEDDEPVPVGGAKKPNARTRTARTSGNR